MQRLGRERLDAFIPRLLAQAVEHDNPDLVLERVLPLVEAVARRSAYLVLLTENPGALRRLLTLCAASPWIAEQIARFPLLLDELLNEGRLFSPPQALELAAELRERLTRIPEDDLEQQMEALRHFKLAHRLRVAASEITGSLPLMKVSDYLTWLAEAILEQVLTLAWRRPPWCAAPSGRHVVRPRVCHRRLRQSGRHRTGSRFGSGPCVHSRWRSPG
jgi:glutamate-ammonia-ligase adenylyltransferase